MVMFVSISINNIPFLIKLRNFAIDQRICHCANGPCIRSGNSANSTNFLTSSIYGWYFYYLQSNSLANLPRLNLAYDPALKYLNQFNSFLLPIIARFAFKSTKQPIKSHDWPSGSSRSLLDRCSSPFWFWVFSIQMCSKRIWSLAKMAFGSSL